MRQEHLDLFAAQALDRGVEIEAELCNDGIWLGRIERIGSHRGIGSIVLEELIDLADDSDMPVRAAVNARSAGLIAWYQDLGFEIEADAGEDHRADHVTLACHPARVPIRSRISHFQKA